MRSLDSALRCAAALFGALALGCSGGDSRPNVLLIVLDTVRSGNVSAYGHHRPTTPRIDAVAADGVLFEKAWAIAPWTTPNHATLFTGLHACQHAVTHESRVLAESHATLAEVLAADGYQTAAFVNNPAAGGRRGFEQGFDRFVPLWRKRVREYFGESGDEPDTGAAATGRAVGRWLDERDPEKPFFVFINYLEAHKPYVPPDRLRWDEIRGLQPRRRVVNYDYVEFHAGAYALTPEEFAVAEALYDAEIRRLDEHVGALLDSLAAQGLLDETLVVITSDHGELFGENGKVGHQFTLLDPVLGVPLILRLPGVFDGGRRVSAPVSLLDVYPTVLEVADSTPPAEAEIEGRSLLAEPEREDFYAEYYRPRKHLERLRDRFPDFDASPLDRRIRSLRSGGYKYLWSSDGRHELYDLERDPGETANLVAELPAIARRMDAKLVDWYERKRAPGVDAPAPESLQEDDETRRALEALGYAQ